VKLLFDHNISPELIVLLSDLFPDSNHVYPLNLYEQPDTIVWAYARTHDFIVVSKDADFAEISIRTSYEFIVEMVEDPGRSILSLFRHDRSS
jgi:predicted nuclease of predicted toxin-antitoxin system